MAWKAWIWWVSEISVRAPCSWGSGSRPLLQVHHLPLFRSPAVLPRVPDKTFSSLCLEMLPLFKMLLRSHASVELYLSGRVSAFVLCSHCVDQ